MLRIAADSWFDGFYSLRIVTAKLPFGGTPRTLPGTLRVADFDEGGEQISYHDNSRSDRDAVGRVPVPKRKIPGRCPAEGSLEHSLSSTR